VCGLLTKLRLQPIVLHEQANKGRTVIEKFEAHSDVAFAIVIVTGDDLGAAKISAKNVQALARQKELRAAGLDVDLNLL
jgi:predicted nucleotide-binding protein